MNDPEPLLSDAEQEDLDWAFDHIPQLAALARGELAVVRLPGLTNRNYRLYSDRHDWVLRVPRASTNRLIDRAAEAHNQGLACRLGLAPPTAWSNPAGMSLTATLKGTRSAHATDFDSPSRLAQIGEALRRLHRSGQRFRGGLSLRATLEQHYELLAPPARETLAVRMVQARRTLTQLEAWDLAAVPSHRDPVAGNLLFDDQRLWLIDWEYAAMASPYWDLAILCNDANLDLVRSQRLLQAYCADGPAMQESILFDYRGLLKLLNDCWIEAFSQR